MIPGSISVALATYNAGPFLTSQLGSLLAQTRPPDEVVVRDDASTDQTYQELQRFAARAPFRVDLRQNQINIGVTRNFEAALGSCTGEYIALCDQDDIWHPEKLEHLCGALDNKPLANLAFSDAALVDDMARSKGITAFQCVGLTPANIRSINDGSGLKSLRTRHIMVGATAVYRRTCHQILLPFPESLEKKDSFWIHDGWIGAVLSSVGEVHVDPRLLIRYRIHPNQAMGLIAPVDRAMATSRPPLRSRKRRDVLDDHLREELAQVEPIAERLSNLPGSNQSLHAIASDLLAEASHYRSRLSLDERVVARSLQVLDELRRGGYHRHAKGWKSAGADLLRR